MEAVNNDHNRLPHIINMDTKNSDEEVSNSSTRKKGRER